MWKPIQYRGVINWPDTWDPKSPELTNLEIKEIKVENEWGFFPVSAERLDALKADEESGDE